MDDQTDLEHRLTEAEELLNLSDALRPDLPAEELYELALQTLLDMGGYRAGSLWVHRSDRYRSALCYGVEPRRAALLRDASLDEVAFHQLLSQLTPLSGMHWRPWPLPPDTPAPLRPPESAGHTLIVPLAFLSQLGFAALEARDAAPPPDRLATLGRFADKIAVALDTALLFQEHIQTIDELQRLTEQQQQLQATVLELSAPLLPLLPGVLVLPLVGVIDSLRAERILAAELEAIIEQQAEVVLVDITGVPLIDTAVAIQLVRSAEAARLLGCRTLLVGVKPEIAQTLVGLGVDLHGITTRATLAEGLQEALRMVHRGLITI